MWLNKKSKKYKRVYHGVMPFELNGENREFTMYRLKALRDIPEHGVKSGDLGGYVTKAVGIQHEGSCWIGENAIVVGEVSVEDNSYIGGNARVFNDYYNRVIALEDDASVTGDAYIYIEDDRDYLGGAVGLVLRRNVKVHGNAVIKSGYVITDNTVITGKAQLNKVDTICGDILITDNAVINEGSTILGKSIIEAGAQIGEKVSLEDCVIGGQQKIAPHISLSGKVLRGSGSIDSMSYGQPNPPSGITSPEISSGKTMESYQTVMADIASYETDIVKVIKYPVMTDRTDVHTRKMVMAVKKAARYFDDPASNDFKDAVHELEEAFLCAESNARKLASTLLTEEEKKRTIKATDLFAVASNEASSENEKRVAFVQGFKQLEGVVNVPDAAIDTFRIKIGLQEIEA